MSRLLGQWVLVISAALGTACAQGETDAASSTLGSASEGTSGDASTLGSVATGDASTAAASSASAASTGVGTDDASTTADASSGGSGEATCAPCPGEPCTRPCLPPLGPDGPATLDSYSQGACPALIQDGRNVGFGYNARDFDLYVPTSTNGPYAVVFAWHGDGDTATAFGQALLGSYDSDGYVLVVPDGQSRYDSQWHVEVEPGVAGSPATDDLRFVDDVIACLWEQLPIDLRRIHTVGFSVGGRFSAYLMGHRSDRFGSAVTWSGGDRTPQDIIVVPAAAHPIPGLLYHGGVSDTPACCGETATEGLATTMVQNGQFTVVCDHGQGHSYPPGDAAGELWNFMVDHPFSPGADALWREAGLPASFPDYCEVRSM